MNRGDGIDGRVDGAIVHRRHLDPTVSHMPVREALRELQGDGLV